MDLLVIGGTGLSGTAIVRAALRRGHRVVAAHRGTTDTLAGVEHPLLRSIVHDRADGHAPFAAHGPYDAVIDVSARVPAWVPDAAAELDAGAPHWVQLSTVGVYADLAVRGPSEDAPLATFDDARLEHRVTTDPHVPFSYEWYNPAKAACERLLRAAIPPDRVTILRPVLITGAHDDTWRVPYWVERIARGGTALAPPREAPVSIIDARDLASFALECAERRLAGSFNVAPPSCASSIGDLLDAVAVAVRASGRVPARVVNADAAFLAEHEVAPWSELPAWLPAELALDGMLTSDSTRAHASGLTTRPLVDTASALLRWIEETGAVPGLRGAGTGLEPARERALLTALAAR